MVAVHDVTKFDADIIGAENMILTGAVQVACCSQNSRKAIVATFDDEGGSVSIKKTPQLEHRVRFIAHSESILYLTAPRNFRDPGYLYVFRKNALDAPLAKIEDPFINGPVVTQTSLSVFIYSRSDRPSLVARSKSDYSEVAEFQTAHAVRRIYVDPVDPGKLYCTNETNNEVEVVVWNEDTNSFSYEDPIILPHATGLLDLFVRDGQFLYTTRTRVVHYDPESRELKFNYHDFWNKFASIDPVTAIDFGSLDDAELPSPDRLGNVEVNTLQNDVNSVRGVTVTFGECPAGDYEIEWLEGMAQIIPGEYTVMGETPGIGASTWQGFVINHDDLDTRVPFAPVTGQTGEIGGSPGKYDSRANGIAAYTGAKTLFTHTGGRIWLELWDTDFSTNDTDLSDLTSRFRLRQLTGNPTPDVPPGSDGIPIEGTGLIIWQHPNLDQNPNVTDDDLKALDDARLTGELSRQSRNRFKCNPLFEQFGELYGTSEAPFERQFDGVGPRVVIRMVNNTHIALDSARGNITFSGSLVLRLNFDIPSNEKVFDSRHCQDFEFVEQFDFGTEDERTENIRLPIVKSRVGYPYANAVTFPGKDRRVWGEGKSWNSVYFAGDVSVCAWVRPVSNGNFVYPVEDWQRIISNKDTWKSEFGFHLNVVAPDPNDPATRGRISFFASGGNTNLPGDPDGYNAIQSINNIPLTDGNWHFVAASAGTSTGRVYHNGVDVTRLSNAGLVKPSINPLRLGRIYGQDVSPDFFKGDMTDIRVYNAALTAADILAIFEATRAQFGV